MTHAKRRIIASLIVTGFLVFWIWAAASLGSYLVTWPKWIQPVFFITAGLGWALPLRPVFLWMNKTDNTDS
ncbi:MAG: DUF2842 domain-containing protein [Henriciella sp.]